MNISTNTPETEEFYKHKSISDEQLFAQNLEHQRDFYKTAIEDCLAWANGHQYEWGDRAENAFQFLENAMNKTF